MTRTELIRNSITSAVEDGTTYSVDDYSILRSAHTNKIVIQHLDRDNNTAELIFDDDATAIDTFIALTVTNTQHILLGKFNKRDARYKDISFEFTYDKTQLETKVLLYDDSTLYIFIQSSMIFVCDCDYATLSKRIEAETADDACEHAYDISGYEAYDLSDGQPYYMNSDYSELINISLVHLTCNLLK